MTVVAIDGPAGAGKSTVARALAAELGFGYLDTGAMYRAVALAALREGAAPAAIAASLQIELGERVQLNGEDVTAEIRTPEVTDAASRAAADPEVRRAVVLKQQELLTHGDWVAEGRDIGTVVAPDAEVKVFLTASEAIRARRRSADLAADPKATAELTQREQARRDQRDAPQMARAADAVEIDTTALDLDQVIAEIVGLARSRRPVRRG